MISDEEFNLLKERVNKIVIKLDAHIQSQKERDEYILNILNTEVKESKQKIQLLKKQLYENHY